MPRFESFFRFFASFYIGQSIRDNFQIFSKDHVTIEILKGMKGLLPCSKTENRSTLLGDDEDNTWRPRGNQK